jgi:hypothetical protein
MNLDPGDLTSAPPGGDALPEPFFHEDSGAVRLWVRTASGAAVGAILRREVLHHRFKSAAAASGADALQAYRTHRDEVDAAVLRRVAAGSLEPVLLREHDLTVHPGVVGPPPSR